ncbi:MAG: carboxypeptidase regulatory-like domain-containing protein, partial [Polyangiaceae bacterium]
AQMRHASSKTFSLVSASLVAIGCVVLGPSTIAGCGSSRTSGFDDGTGMDAGLFDEAGNPIFGDTGTGQKPGCVGLQCQQKDCGSGVSTTLSGTAFAPNGTLPLYNVIVYVPNTKLDPIPNGASCDKCGAQVSGNPVVTTLTDAKGNFSLKNVPVGKDIPLVFQVGKWRRQVTVPNVAECKETKLTDPEMTRLPRNQSEGSIPKIAVTTGACDPLGCILPKIGIDASEYGFGGDVDAKRVHLYTGTDDSLPAPSPNNAPSAVPLWSDANKMKSYDIMLLNCECNEHLESKPAAALAAMETYANNGGRVFGSHYHYAWMQYGSAAFQSTAQWKGDGNAPSGGSPYKINTSFPKGQALADWLVAQGVTPAGAMPLNDVRQDVGAVTAATTTSWVTNSAASSTKYLSFNTPVGAPEAMQCGKVVHGDIHISASGGGGGSVIDDTFPAGCSKTLSAQEKALIFLFFDLSSCIQPDGQPPMPPPVK